MAKIYGNTVSTTIPLVGVKGAGENSEIFNDYENNKAISSFTHARGTRNISGGRSFKFNVNNPGTSDHEGKSWYILDPNINIDAFNILKEKFLELQASGKKLRYSVVMTWNFDFDGEVLDVKEHYISDSDELMFRAIAVSNWRQPNETGLPKDEEGKHNVHDGSYIHFPDYPELGDNIIGTSADTSGYGNKAIGSCSNSAGYNNISGGKYSTTNGHSNRAGYAADAGGRETQADAEYSFTRGYKTKVRASKGAAFGQENVIEKDGSKSFIAGGQGNIVNAANSVISGGINNKANGVNSHVQNSGNIASGPNSDAGGYETRANAENTFTRGQGTSASVKNQAVVGQNNADDYEALFIVGNGENGKSNALAVRKNGQIIAKTAPTTNESLTNKKYVDDIIPSKIDAYIKDNGIVDEEYVKKSDKYLADTLSQHGVAFVVGNKKYYMTDIPITNAGKKYYAVFSDSIVNSWSNYISLYPESDDGTNIKVRILDGAISSTSKSLEDKKDELFGGFGDYTLTQDWSLGTMNGKKYYTTGSVIIPTYDEVKELISTDKFTLQQNRIFIRKYGYWNNSHLQYMYRASDNGTDNTAMTTSTIDDMLAHQVSSGFASIMYIAYVSEDFFTKTHLNIAQMGTKFKEILTSIFTKEQLSSVYTNAELDVIYNTNTAELEYNPESTQAQSGVAVAQAIAQLLGSAPENLDTLEELAKALDNDESFSTKVIDGLARVDGIGETLMMIRDRAFERQKDSFVSNDDFTISSIDETLEVTEVKIDTYIDNGQDTGYFPIAATFKDTKAREMIGDIETALDSILAMQTELIGGDA